jgi:hypothetical protein
MGVAVDQLPPDPDRLRAIVAEQAAELAAKDHPVNRVEELLPWHWNAKSLADERGR